MPPLNDPPPTAQTTAPTTGREYWRSLDHLAQTPEFLDFLHREFPAGASELLAEDRRHFLKIMGASMALAGLGLAGCRRWPAEEIAPFASRPVDRDPGTSVSYATTMDLGGVASGLLATAVDGRPIKIEGNPDHPTSGGAADVYAQASILDLYDPDRSRAPVRDGAPAAWAEFAVWADDRFKKARNKRGHGLAVLSEANSSESLARLRRHFHEVFPNATWHEYEPVGSDQEIEGSTLAFGAPYREQLDLESAQVLVTLDADLLGAHPNAVSNIRGFARGRKAADPQRTMNRLYAVESDFTITGANADHRLAIRSADTAVIAAYLAARILDAESLKRMEDLSAGQAILSPAVREVLDHAIEDLEAHRGAGVIVAGPRQPAEVHLLAHLMNAALGNAGTTVTYTPQRDRPRHVEAIRSLVESKVETLVILGGNPVFDAPADLDFASFLSDLAASGNGAAIHLADSVNETSAACSWHVNRAHYLETWGDGRAWDGTFSIRQPLIEPLFLGHSEIELLALICGDDVTLGQMIVQQTFADMVGRADSPQWRRTLHDGMLSGSAFTRETPAAKSGGLEAASEALLRDFTGMAEGYEIAFGPSPTLYDGRFANNGWLQELPDPITKLTWDNAVIMSPATAEALDLETGDRMTINSKGVSVESAALVQPGIADRSLVLHLGGGRAFAGRVSAGAGFDFQRLRTSGAMGFATGVTVAATGGSYPFAVTQDHHSIEPNSVGGSSIQERLPQLFREATREQFLHDENFARNVVHVTSRLSLWEETNLEGGNFAWAMSIDLNSCVGCGACVVACQAENNIPVVGKDQVLRGREMHWIRIDRYFAFGRNAEGKYDPHRVETTALQPVTCMHCQNAPCEQVCPVAATVHDEDGLNVMVYNRCIGTRYCSNNCPYKVRRFNYFDYHRRDPLRKQDSPLQVQPSYYTQKQATPDQLRQLQFNPEVTVRMRGVMEKCTFCTQRIAEGRIAAKNAFAAMSEEEKALQAGEGDRVPVTDGAITPACAQTCPAEAIVFGDLKDTGSRVTDRHRDPRAYEMLEELNVKARLKYLAKLRNPAFGGARPGGHAAPGGSDHGGESEHG